jgi:DtxR family Mn-dependent transcriptional regulator
MSSDSVEEYLEAIHSFNEKGEMARNMDLSKRLKVAPPSVTQMIKKLANEGLVEYEPYKGTVLTGKGMAKAQKVVRRHRILERFLHDFLGLKDEKVHEEACRMEHSLSDETALAMCKALENPKTCRMRRVRVV